VKTVPIVALDVPSQESAGIIVSALGDLCRFYKVGSELSTSAGPSMVRFLRDHGNEVFLDLKWHDIPNTIKGAARSASRLGARLVTVHASGGIPMMRAAVEGAQQGGGQTKVLAVTVLTSFDAERLNQAWGRPNIVVADEVLRLAGQAVEAGVQGIVCGGTEAAAVRKTFGNALEILVPGVRLTGAASNDQVRVVSPKEAAAAGANYIVVGRTVTADAAPREAIRRVIDAVTN
jgi:orotidine-5'-phosphate decarboxylase